MIKKYTIGMFLKMLLLEMIKKKGNEVPFVKGSLVNQGTHPQHDNTCWHLKSNVFDYAIWIIRWFINSAYCNEFAEENYVVECYLNLSKEVHQQLLCK